MMKGLLVIAHGSRRAQSNEEILQLTEKVAAHAAATAIGEFDHIEAAFLELAKPSIPEGIQSLVDKGVQSMVIMPYFLANGMHVATDIPEFIEEAEKLHPGLKITVSAYVGAAEIMPSLILDAASKAD